MRLFRNHFSVIGLSLLGIFPAILAPSARPAYVYAAPAAEPAPTDAALATRLDAILAPMFPADRPGATVLLARNGKPIYRKAFGKADMEAGTPLQPESVLRIGSVTKQFTSAAILRLADQGKLSVTDSITKWLPDFPTHGKTMGDHLVSQRVGGARSEIFPVNDSTFALAGRPVKLTFGRGVSGKVDRVMLQQGGFRQTATKTNDPLPTERTVATLSPEALAACVGEYQLAPGFILTVTQEGNALMAQATGQPKFEIYPESETRFFLKVVDAQIEFQKGSDGKMSALTLHQGGAHMPAPRIK
ncbi:MAG: serine hydrolase [Candidatus Eisenbacteria bacterium]|nr:serine hydrolase [Candidatus Eisenbacteria bacterium]